MEVVTYTITGYELADYLLKAKPFKPKPMKSRYKGVYSPNQRHYRKKNQWRGRIVINGVTYDGYYPTEKAAAIAIDKILIKHNKPPANILKKNEQK